MRTWNLILGSKPLDIMLARSCIVLILLIDIATAAVFVEKQEADAVLSRWRRANSGFLEELKQGNLERECREEICDHEEAREVFEDDTLTKQFWDTYERRDPCRINPCLNHGVCVTVGSGFQCQCAEGFEGRFCQMVFEDSLKCNFHNGQCEHFCDGSGKRRKCSCADGYILGEDGRQCIAQAEDHCLSSPCKNGGTCTRKINTFVCQCTSGFHGSTCDKARLTSNGCRYRNGGCEHFCKEFPNRTHTCFCATGYRLDQDNSTCSPQVTVPCGRPLVHFGPRVVNGEICPKGHCPWQALLTENHQQICGGIVLSDQWILTAAHCVWKKQNSVLHVIVGEHDLETDEKTEQKRRVSKVLIHRGYNHSSYDSDLALLKLHRPIKLGLYVIPICLPAKNSSFTGTLAAIRHNTVSGWGRLSLHGSTARLLQRLALPQVPLQECRLHTKLNITRNMLCAGLQRGGQDACKGDSGGPLVTRYKKTWFLTGVVSWGNGCADNNMYGIYTKVSNFLDWIQHQMTRW